MKTPFSRPLCLAVALFHIAGCATHPDDIRPNYESPSRYSSIPCDQLQEDRSMAHSELNASVDAQREAANNDVAIMTIGMILFWPILFGLAATDDHEYEVASLKGQYQAMDAAYSTRCTGNPVIATSK